MARGTEIILVKWEGTDDGTSEQYECFSSVGAIYQRYTPEQIGMGQQSMLNTFHRLRMQDKPLDFRPRKNPKVRIAKTTLYEKKNKDK